MVINYAVASDFSNLLLLYSVLVILTSRLGSKRIHCNNGTSRGDQVKYLRKLLLLKPSYPELFGKCGIYYEAAELIRLRSKDHLASITLSPVLEHSPVTSMKRFDSRPHSSPGTS